MQYFMYYKVTVLSEIEFQSLELCTMHLSALNCSLNYLLHDYAIMGNYGNYIHTLKSKAF